MDHKTRRSAYAALAYYSARAEHALEKGDMAAHIAWARKYHELRTALGWPAPSYATSYAPALVAGRTASYGQEV